MPRSIFVILVVLVCILSAIAQDVDYYSGIDKNAKDDDLKKQLQVRHSLSGASSPSLPAVLYYYSSTSTSHHHNTNIHPSTSLLKP